MAACNVSAVRLRKLATAMASPDHTAHGSDGLADTAYRHRYGGMASAFSLCARTLMCLIYGTIALRPAANVPTASSRRSLLQG